MTCVNSEEKEECEAVLGRKTTKVRGKGQKEKETVIGKELSEGKRTDDCHSLGEDCKDLCIGRAEGLAVGRKRGEGQEKGIQVTEHIMHAAKIFIPKASR